MWWVQEAVRQSDARYVGAVQFGETWAGASQCFAIIALRTDQALKTGDQIQDLPRNALHSGVTYIHRQSE